MRAIITFIAGRNALAAADLRERIELCAERLVDHPFLYRPGRVAGTREAVVHPNYIVIYRVTDEAVEVLNVVHSRQLYPPEA